MTSLRRTCVPFKTYSLMPSRCTTRSTTTSLKSRSRRRLPDRPGELSNVTFTLARFCRGIAGEPPQMRSSPFFERIDFIDCSPKTKRNPSATLDFPLPLGPTTATIGVPKVSSVFLPNDLKPESSIDLRLRHIEVHCIKQQTLEQIPRGMPTLVTTSRTSRRLFVGTLRSFPFLCLFGVSLCHLLQVDRQLFYLMLLVVAARKFFSHFPLEQYTVSFLAFRFLVLVCIVT